MISAFIFGICFFSCVVGAICGIGGGVIIKPVLDMLGSIDAATVSFLSGCTVLSMTAYSVIRTLVSRQSGIVPQTGTPLALGAAIGGILGKQLFQWIRAASANPNRVGAIQAICLMIVTLGTLLYTVKKSTIKTLQVENRGAICLIGFFLGLLSSFLGIGGGPMNLVVLFYFFSMETKVAVENSLYVILFSQTTSLLYTILTHTVPDFPALLLFLMPAGGIFGGICGRGINRKLESASIDILFMCLMIGIILICTYNCFRYLR